MMSVKADSADGLYATLLPAVKRDGHLAMSRIGATRELLHVSAELADPRNRWTVHRNPPLNAAFAVAEMVWIIRGRRDAAFLNYFNTALPKYAGTGSTYAGAYGWRLQKNLGFEQLRAAYRALKVNPDSRQVVLQIWDGKRDFPGDDGKPRSADIPCNIVSLLKVRGGCLDWTQIMRSNDIFRGWPYNILQWTTLQEVMAGWLGLSLGTYHHISDSLHMYESDGKAAAHGGDCAEPDMDMRLPWVLSDAAWRRLELAADMIRHEKRFSCAGLVRELKPIMKALPSAYRILLSVMAAEGLRRRGDPEAAYRELGGSAPALTAAWRWTEARTVKP